MKLPPFDVPRFDLDAPPLTTLTYQGVPVAWDEQVVAPEVVDGRQMRAYWFRGDVAAARVKAGYEPVPACAISESEGAEIGAPLTI